MGCFLLLPKVSLSIFANKTIWVMNIFTKLITYDKNGKCENPVALKEKQEREKLAYRAKIEGRLKISNFEEVRTGLGNNDGSWAYVILEDYNE